MSVSQEIIDINKSINGLGLRLYRIEQKMKELTDEKSALEFAQAKLESMVCSSCRGEGNVMRYIEGCECDGPRLQKCLKCKGTGKLSRSITNE